MKSRRVARKVSIAAARPELQDVVPLDVVSIQPPGSRSCIFWHHHISFTLFLSPPPSTFALAAFGTAHFLRRSAREPDRVADGAVLLARLPRSVLKATFTCSFSLLQDLKALPNKSQGHVLAGIGCHEASPAFPRLDCMQ